MKPFADYFDGIAGQFTSWWKRENDRPLVYIPSRWPSADQLPPPPANPRDNYLDAETIFRKTNAMAETISPGGVYFPFYSPFPPTSSFYGAIPVFTQQTIWHEPVLTGDHPFTGLAFQENEYWHATLTMLKQLVELADGHFYVSVPNGYSPLDLLESLRGGTRLSMDLVDIPDEVKAAQEIILAAWRKQYDTYYEIVGAHYDGTGTSFLPLWSPKRSYSIQCDFSCMISAEMFEEFVVPEVIAQAQYVDHSIFHLDGPDAARHADLLIRIPELNGIQWQKGVNGGKTLSWLPLLKKIQQAGKLVVVDALPDEVETLCAELEPEGLFVGTACKTPEEAEALLAKIYR
ncbi:MAG: uroporphyrinogen decarboxylase/cobalamine-independent methonine synthase family protein [Armatimonadota bacterium]